VLPETGSGDIARAGWREGGLDDADVRILAQAGPIPSDIFVAHRSVSPALVSQLQAAFVDARPRAVHEAAKTLVHADAFLRPTSEHLSLLRGLLAGIEAEASPRRRA
jgi:ABC-type phosphate/phosphonate transport system substrate-binding protein